MRRRIGRIRSRAVKDFQLFAAFSFVVFATDYECYIPFLVVLMTRVFNIMGAAAAIANKYVPKNKKGCRRLIDSVSYQRLGR